MENDIVNKPKPQRRKKHLWRILIALVAVASAVGVFFLVKNLQNNADIKVGDTVITKSHIEKVSQQAEDYKKTSPNAAVDARNALIENASLKYHAKQTCQRKELFSPKEIFNFSQPSDKVESDTDPRIEQVLGKSGDFYYVTQENALYKNKLQDCLIKEKEVFSVSISYETPFMASGETDQEATAKYNAAKEELRTKFLPLFKSKLSKEEIAKHAKVDLIADPSAENFDIRILETEMVSFAKMIRLNGANGTAGFQTDTPLHKGDLGKVVELNDEVAKLKAGEFSDVLTTSSGVFAIVRTEKENEGHFSNWQDFLRESKEKFQTEKGDADKASAGQIVDRVCWAVSGDQLNKTVSTSCQPSGGGRWVSKPGFEFYSPAYTGETERHLKGWIIHAWDGPVGGIPLNDVGVHGAVRVFNKRTNRVIDNVKAWSKDKTSYVHYRGLSFNGQTGLHGINSHGVAFVIGDCNVGTHLTASFTAPKGYKYTGGSKTMMLVDGNYANETHEDISLQREVTPPPDDPKPTPATNQANASTKIAITKRSETPAHHTNVWRTGTVLAPVGHHISFKHEINGTIKRNNLSRIDMIWSTKRGKSRELNLGSKAEGLIVRQGNTTQLVNSSQDTPPDAAYWVTSRDTGTTICDNIRFDINHEQAYGKGIVRNGQQAHDRTVDGRVTTSGASAQACAYVPYEFGLTPCIANGISNCQTGDTPIEGKGKPPTFTPNISNGSGTPTPSGTIFKITTWHIPSIGEGAQTPTSGVDNEEKNTCLHYRNQFKTWAFLNCKAEESTRGFPSGQTNLNQYIPPVPPNAEIGSRYCVGVSVSAHTMRPDETEQTQKSKIGREWRHSAPLCVLIVKKPKLQIWGNGIYSLGGIRTSTSQRDGQNFGSWVEFEAITGRNVRGFGTAANLEGNRMTFTNTNPNQLGLWGNWQGRNNQNRLADQIRTRFGTESKGNATSRIWIENHGDVVLSGIDGTKKNFGNTHIIYAKNVTINGNITARSPWLSLANWFQQTIIIADNINISPNVTQIDAWLIAGNTINTCNVPDRDLNNNSCGRQLRVNGAVYAGQKLEARRTAGSGNGSPSEYSEPAEIFNQRPDAYFWARGHSVSPNKIVTTYTRELPARL